MPAHLTCANSLSFVDLEGMASDEEWPPLLWSEHPGEWLARVLELNAPAVVYTDRERASMVILQVRIRWRKAFPRVIFRTAAAAVCKSRKRRHLL
jgi:hypothetical protein